MWRAPRTLRDYDGAEATLDGRRVKVFCSNDYLGLANHPEVTSAFAEAAKAGGAGAAHLVSGHRAEHEALEAALADWLGRDQALLFSTGYMANVGVIDALLGKGDALFQDRLNHASLLDGGRISGARMRRYRHADPAHLATLLDRRGGAEAEAMIASDGVFSMDGDIAPLPALVELARRHEALLLVDDAHGLGVLGEQGGGVCDQFGLGQDDVPLLVGTLGKAFGVFGAFVAGPADWIELIRQRARSYIYTTAAPPALAAACGEALRIIRGDAGRRRYLAGLIKHFRQRAEALGLPLMTSTTPIQPLPIGDAARALAASETLLARGFWVSAIRAPTVPKGTERLRITLSAAHEQDDVDALLDALAEVLAE